MKHIFSYTGFLIGLCVLVLWYGLFEPCLSYLYSTDDADQYY